MHQLRPGDADAEDKLRNRRTLRLGMTASGFDSDHGLRSVALVGSIAFKCSKENPPGSEIPFTVTNQIAVIAVEVSEPFDATSALARRTVGTTFRDVLEGDSSVRGCLGGGGSPSDFEGSVQAEAVNFNSDPTSAVRRSPTYSFTVR
ncbi:MAG: hypothetical protein AAF481_17105 [Acidobacteriota bacterium]